MFCIVDWVGLDKLIIYDACRLIGKGGTSLLHSILVKTTPANRPSVNFPRVSSTLMSTHLEPFACQSSMKIADGDQQLQSNKFLLASRIYWISPTLLILHRLKDITSLSRIQWSIRDASDSRQSSIHLWSKQQRICFA